MDLAIRFPSGKVERLTVTPQWKLGQLKKAIEKITKIPRAWQSLVLDQQALEDDGRTLVELEVNRTSGYIFVFVGIFAAFVRKRCRGEHPEPESARAAAKVARMAEAKTDQKVLAQAENMSDNELLSLSFADLQRTLAWVQSCARTVGVDAGVPVAEPVTWY